MISEEIQKSWDRFLETQEEVLDGQIYHCQLTGQLKHADLLAFTTLIDRQYEKGQFKIIMGFTRLDTLLSSHLGALWQRCQIARKNGGDIKIYELSDLIREAFTRVGFHRLISIHDNLEGAIESFRRDMKQ